MKKIMLGTSDTWSMSRSSQQPSEPAYYIVDCQIFDLLGIHNPCSRCPILLLKLYIPSTFSNMLMLCHGKGVLEKKNELTIPNSLQPKFKSQSQINIWNLDIKAL